eukprot:9481877-Pyramimonas_sp.AAC.2
MIANNNAESDELAAQAPELAVNATSEVRACQMPSLPICSSYPSLHGHNIACYRKESRAKPKHSSPQRICCDSFHTHAAVRKASLSLPDRVRMNKQLCPQSSGSKQGRGPPGVRGMKLPWTRPSSTPRPTPDSRTYVDLS